ncbi:unnamed protein product [Leptosia nina]|uniref:Uncharacterized protein n=1 Tax=Leptosia nina TaxID=320188 RepID=A0AAV1J0F3_9NEOP
MYKLFLYIYRSKREEAFLVRETYRRRSSLPREANDARALFARSGAGLRLVRYVEALQLEPLLDAERLLGGDHLAFELKCLFSRLFALGSSRFRLSALCTSRRSAAAARVASAASRERRRPLRRASLTSQWRRGR